MLGRSAVAVCLSGLQESRAFHAQRIRLMQLTDMLAQHVEQHRHSLSSSSGGGGCSSSGGGGSPGRGGDDDPAAADGTTAAAAKHTAGIDNSLVGCLAKLREPETGELFDHKVGPVTNLTAADCMYCLCCAASTGSKVC